MRIYEKTYVEIVKNLGTTYNMNEIFHDEVLVSIKVTPLGANYCLVKDLVDGKVMNLIEERKVWWGQWFKEVRLW